MAGALGLYVVKVADFETARAALEENPPLCAVVDWRSAVGRDLCLGVRGSPVLADLPLVAVVDDPWSPTVGEAFTSGADDYVAIADLEHVRGKLASLRGSGIALGGSLTGAVILADPDRQRRVQLARHLGRMGLNVRFALDADGIPNDPEVRLVVAHYELPPHGILPALRRLETARASDSAIPWVVVGPTEALTALKNDVGDAPGLKFFDEASDPAQIVFLANQLLVGQAKAMRRSPRLLYQVPAAMSAAGGPAASPAAWGYTYNINRGGLFIRTITPPAAGSMLEIEFTPPHGRGRVRVEGKVVWRQEFPGTRSSPAGCGIQYGELPLADGAALEVGYGKLLEESGEQAD